MSTKSKKSVGKSKGTARSSTAAKTDGAKPSPKAPKTAPAEGTEPRRLGIRGAAPWAARHAAKHAAEARARAAEPPPPGSARATLRVPSDAEQIKARIIELHNIVAEIKNLRKNLSRSFYDIALKLRDIQSRKLYEVRGFGTFEAFVERELDLGKTTAVRLVRVAEVFKQKPAVAYGLDRVLAALGVLEGEAPAAIVQPASPSTGSPLPMRPPQVVRK